MYLVVQSVQALCTLKLNARPNIISIVQLITPTKILTWDPMVKECGSIIDVADLRAQHLKQLMLCVRNLLRAAEAPALVDVL